MKTKPFRKNDVTAPMTLRFTRTNAAADTAIDQLIDLVGGIQHPEIVREMIIASLKAGQENGGMADLKLMNTSLKEMRFTSKVFRPYRHVKKVTIFGSARIEPDTVIYHAARRLGEKLAEADYMVITGGGPGIMHAVNEGAGPEHSFGVNIRLPFEQKPNPVLVGNPRHIMYKYFFNRKVAFLKEAHAIILFPGGFGTLDEAMETVTLVQTGKRYSLPILFFDEPQGTYWERVMTFFERELLERGYISKEDFDLFECVYSAEEAVERIQQFYTRYHSLRYVGDQLVIRLITPIAPEHLEALKGRFKDILTDGGDMVQSAALPEEAEEVEIIDLPRLVIDFNQRDFGRLRALIDAVNAM